MNRGLQRLSAILFGLLLLAGVEVGLRLLWTPPPLPGEELALVAIDPFNEKDGVAETDPAFKGAMRFSSFAVAKQPDTFRVFCLGGSTTMGYPSPPAAAWPAVLERGLRRLLPDRKVEVINVGGNSYGTGRVLAVMRGILKYQPDLVIEATGDTEFVEDSFRQAVKLPRGSKLLQKLYLARAVKNMLPVPAPKVPVIDVNDLDIGNYLFAPMPDNTVYKVTPADRKKVLARMQDNLQQMVELARSEQIPLVLCTLPSNVSSWGPDQDAARPVETSRRLRWENLWNTGRLYAARNQPEKALESFAAAVRIWSDNAQFCYEYARLLQQTGADVEARAWFVRARDLDPVPVRSTTAAQDLVRAAARTEGVFLADVAHTFRTLEEQGTAAEELIFDYAHPTPRGHVEIAQQLWELITRSVLKMKIDPELLGRISAEELAGADAVRWEANADTSYVLGQVFERKKLYRRAADMFRKAIETGNRGPEVRFDLAMVLAKMGDLPAALDVATRLSESHPDWSRTFVLLGYLRLQAGMTDDALASYQRAINAGQNDYDLYGVTAELMMEKGKGSEAAKLLRDALNRYPNDCRLSSLLGDALAQVGDQAGAERLYRETLGSDPGCQQAAEGLGLLLMNQQQWVAAEKVFRSALEQPFPLAAHHFNLGIIYSVGLNEKTTALEEFRTFVRLEPGKAGLVPPEFRKDLTRTGR